MDFNSYKYLEFDEQEIKKEEEEQHKEIQALLASEFYGLELDDDDDEETSNGCFQDEDEIHDVSQIDEDSRYDKENVFNGTHGIPEQATSWVPHPLTAFYAAPQAHNLNYFNYQPPQSNNNCHRDGDMSINWDISLCGEMGMPISQNSNQFYSDKVAYMATSTISTKEPSCFSNLREESPIKELPSPMKIIRRDVAVECIPVNQRELDNLELLYSARGKRIEQLQTELESEKEKRLREIRVLNHKVTLLESEQKNESNLLKSYKAEMNDQRESINDKDQIIERQARQLADLEATVEKLTVTVDARTSIVESLNMQLTELQSQSSMARNNQKHAELVECINFQFDTDAHRFQAEISRLSGRLDDKRKEIERLQVQLDEQVDFYQSQKKIWTQEKEHINDSLVQEQLYRKQLETSISQETVHQLQSQVHELTLGKSMFEDMNFYLQDEVHELTNQLLAYEKSLSLLEHREHGSGSSFIFDYSTQSGLGRTRSFPVLSEISEIDNVKANSNNGTEGIRREVFTLTSRTHSLTNRLLDVRKENLDLKTNLKKLQQTIAEQNDVLFVLEEKFAKAETRLGQLQSGNETDVEKQLRNANESMEIIKKSLELQCNSLLTQLKQANERMEEMETIHRQSEKDFAEFKDELEEEKLTAIEEVKRACSNHFDNLRQQLEISWMTEKDAFIVDERRQREEIQLELCDALKEVDRVKNLYIEYSQQRSTEEANLTNWNEWLTKKLEEQKRSLNQQFQNDYHTKMMEIKTEYEDTIKKLQSEQERPRETVDKAVGSEITVTSVGSECGRDMSDNSCQASDVVVRDECSVQTTETMDHFQQLEDLVATNQQLQSTIETLQGLVDSQGRECKHCTQGLSPASSQEISHSDDLLPHIVRSSSPQFVHSTINPAQNYTNHKSTRTSVNGVQTLFRSLKEDLVSQLKEVSRSVQYGYNQDVKKCRNMAQSVIEPLDGFDRVKEHLYKYILQMQVRAAETIQREVHSSQIRIRCDLLRQLRQILPLTLSVDGQIINVAPDKMRVLTDKVTLILDRLQTDDYSPVQQQQPRSSSSINYLGNHSPNFSATSTPIRTCPINRTYQDPRSDVTSICSDHSTDALSPATPPIRHGASMTTMNDTAIHSRSEELQAEITKLYDDLLKTKISCGQKSVRPETLFENVDHNWLYDSVGASVNNGIS